MPKSSQSVHRHLVTSSTSPGYDSKVPYWARSPKNKKIGQICKTMKFPKGIIPCPKVPEIPRLLIHELTWAPKSKVQNPPIRASKKMRDLGRVLKRRPLLSLQPIKNLVQNWNNTYPVGVADKLTNNYIISCKNWWCNKLLDSTIQNKSKAYTTITKFKNHIIKRHQYYLQKREFAIELKLPTKRINSKFHKE